MKTSNSRKSRWRRLWIGLRNRVLSSPRFQRFASHSILTRSVARRRASGIFDLVAGFVYSQILLACVQLKLLDILAEGPSDTATIARRVDLPREGAERLLRAAAALELVEPIGEEWALGSAGAALRGNRGIAEMVAHHPLLYADLADPVALLRRGGGGGLLSGHWRYAESAGCGDAESVAPYSMLMASSQPMVAAQAIDSYPFHRHRRLLDVGGGAGVFVEQVSARVPGLELGLFDLPAVAALATNRLQHAGLSGRLAVFGGDFFNDPLPAGYDLVSLIRVLHDHDDAPALALLRNIHAALPPGGRLFIAEPMARSDGAARVGDAYFGMYLLAMGSGRARSPSEIATLLRLAGFRQSRRLATAMPLTASAMIGLR
ncbi:methyltransferase [Sphingomonas sp. RS6]